MDDQFNWIVLYCNVLRHLRENIQRKPSELWCVLVCPHVPAQSALKTHIKAIAANRRHICVPATSPTWQKSRWRVMTLRRSGMHCGGTVMGGNRTGLLVRELLVHLCTALKTVQHEPGQLLIRQGFVLLWTCSQNLLITSCRRVQHQYLHIRPQSQNTSESRQKRREVSNNKQVRICTLLPLSFNNLHVYRNKHLAV